MLKHEDNSRKCPYPQSSLCKGARFTGCFKRYENVYCDGYQMSWSKDGDLFVCYNDGVIDGVRVQAGREPGNRFTKGLAIPNQVETFTSGSALVSGDDPFNLKFSPCTPLVYKSPRFHSLQATGVLHYNGVCYIGLNYWHRWVNYRNVTVNGENGPFAGFNISMDNGKTWRMSPYDDQKPFFPEFGRPAKKDSLIRFGWPHFVDFGRNMEHSPDGLAYLSCSGTDDPEGVSVWDGGDAVWLCRVKPSPETINDLSAYEFFAGLTSAGEPIWNKDFVSSKPIMRWPGHCGYASIVYDPALKRYLAIMDAGNEHLDIAYDQWLAESENIWGPWRRVECFKAMGPLAYWTVLPSKFISKDGSRFVICYSVWTCGEGRDGLPPKQLSHDYGLNVAEIELLM